MNHKPGIVAALAAALVLVGCGKSDEPEDQIRSAIKSETAESLLQYVPADSPYFMGTLEPAADDVTKKITAMSDDVLRAYGQMLSSLAEIASESDDSDPADAERTKALLGELASVMSVDGLRDLGIEMNTTQALYGVGLLPVLRMNLADADKFEAGIRRFESKAGHTMDTASVGSLTYRYAGDEKARIVIGLVGEQLVVSAVPTAASEDTLKSVFGLTRPGKTLGDTDRLQQLATRYGFLPQGIGYIDTVRLADTFLDAQSGVNADVLGLMGYDDSNLSEVCKREVREAAEVMPAIELGYTRLDTGQFDFRTVMRLRPDLATALRPIAAPVPGVGGDMGGALAYGLGIDLRALREFVEARIAAVESDPWECEIFAPMQEGLMAAGGALQQPIPPMVYNLKGAAFYLDNLDWVDFANKSMRDAPQMRALVAIDDAPTMLMMGQAFVPQLADLALEPNGEEVELPPGTLPMAPGPVYVALSDNAIALGVGQGAAGRTAPMLTAPVAGNPPLSSFSYDIAAYMKLMSQAVSVASDEGGDEVEQQTMESMRGVFDSLSAHMDRVAIDVLVTDNGIELPYVIKLK